MKGVPIGYKIPGWTYRGRWKETKVAPRKWKFSFRATKRRKAKGYGAHPKGRRIINIPFDNMIHPILT